MGSAGGGDDGLVGGSNTDDEDNDHNGIHTLFETRTVLQARHSGND